MSLEVRNLEKSFGPVKAVAGVSFTLEEGQIVALLGPSGSGKSTLLSLIAGLESPDRGEVFWKGQSLMGVPTHQRGFGLMFQDYALFPHKNVARNIGFGLKMQGKSGVEIAAGVERALEQVGLADAGQRDVNTLSGGEQQRVALARSLAPQPRLLMLDEPLGALDRTLRERLLAELGAILRRLGQTALYVTHDQEEAFALADRVLLLRSGQVVQSGPPAEIYAHPASTFVAEFLGLTNILKGHRVRRDNVDIVVTEIGEIASGSSKTDWSEEPVHLLLRPDSAVVATDGDFQIEGTVLEKSFRGSRNVVRLSASGVPLTFEFPASQSLPGEGETLRLRILPAAIHWFP